MKFEYVIVNEAGNLVFVCGESLEYAESALARITAEGKENCHIEQVKKSACWWNDPTWVR